MRIPATILAAALIAGCGAQSDEQQLRDEFAAYTKDLAAGDFAGACERVTDPRECVISLRTAVLLLGGKEEFLTANKVTDELVAAARDAKVTVRGDRATVDNPATPDKGLQAVRDGDRWRLVFPEN